MLLLGLGHQSPHSHLPAATHDPAPTSCMQVLSTIISVYSMLGYFLATAWHACQCDNEGW